MAKTLLTSEDLNRLLRHEPDTGKLFWRERPVGLFEDKGHTAETACRLWNAKHAGKEAFTAVQHGYPQGRILGGTYKAHRVIWCMVYGEWPGHIDHIDGVRSNNLLANLREVTLAENCKNRRPNRNTRSGLAGVCWRERSKRWVASIAIDGRRREIAAFKDASEAHAAYLKAARAAGYHPNHGKRAAG